MFNSLQLHGLQHARLPCPSVSPRDCSSSCPLNWWCLPTISFSVNCSPPDFNLSKHQGLIQCVGSLHHMAKVLVLSFSISPSNEYSGLISFRLTGLISLMSNRLSRVFSSTYMKILKTDFYMCNCTCLLVIQQRFSQFYKFVCTILDFKYYFYSSTALTNITVHE